MIASETFTQNKCVPWSSVDVLSYDSIFLPGGHDKGVRQIIDSSTVHALLAIFKPLTKRSDPRGKILGAVCHGVQVLSTALEVEASDRSVIRDLYTTSLTSTMVSSVYWATRLFPGDYYKIYGAGTPNVEEYVRKGLDDPAKQFKSSNSLSDFVVTAPNYRYLSGPFPGDVVALAEARIKEIPSKWPY